jgi:hypothetical protein
MPIMSAMIRRCCGFARSKIPMVFELEDKQFLLEFEPDVTHDEVMVKS